MPNQDRGILGSASFECRRSRRNLYPWWEIPLEWRNGDILVIGSPTDLTFAFSEKTGTI
ncbi:hypothetical protein [Microcoleus vaginatus]|uniref:hypothetical protein n=1 Tax=Microcoleus vaginatus TaxID=119532 RepID=UPI00168494C7|nr:hypothetical protein [Microcoleus sp. FACHB-84]